MMDKDLETVSLLRNSKGSFHQKMSGMEMYPVLLGTARGGGRGGGAVAGHMLQIHSCRGAGRSFWQFQDSRVVFP